MVGVPGRSKGCHLCRKRKIACSLERPECLMCRNSGKACPGYQRDRIFIHQTTAKSQSVKEGLKLNRQANGARHAKQTQSSPKTATYPEPIPQISNALCITQSRSLVAAASQQQILSLVLSGYGTTSQHDPERSGNWITLIPEMGALSPALKASSLAFCIAKLSKITGNDHLQRESLILYTQALKELQKALWDPKRMYDDQTLGACMLSVMYEVFECPAGSTRGYQNHHDGCARLIQARGPSAHMSGLAHSIFVSFRFIGALQSLVLKTTFLSDPIWKTVPFTVHEKGQLDALIDLLLEAPSILARSDEFRIMSNPVLQLWTALDLLKDCRDLEKRLHSFYNELAASFTSEMYWEVPRSITEEDFPAPSLAKTFPVRFVFVDLRTGGLLSLYWAMMTMLLAGIQALHLGIVAIKDLAAAQKGQTIKSFRDEDHDDIADLADLQNLGQVEDFRSMACNVLKSVKFCLDSGGLGLSIITAPLQMVRDVLKDWPGTEIELRWAHSALEHLVHRGVGIVQYS